MMEMVMTIVGRDRSEEESINTANVVFYVFNQKLGHDPDTTETVGRSQWSSSSMLDCSARGPGIESSCG